MSVQLKQQLHALQQATNSIVEKAYQEKEKNVVAYISPICRGTKGMQGSRI